MARYLQVGVFGRATLPTAANATSWAVSGLPPGLRVRVPHIEGTPTTPGRYLATFVPIFRGRPGTKSTIEFIVLTAAQFAASPEARNATTRFLGFLNLDRSRLNGGGSGLGGEQLSDEEEAEEAQEREEERKRGQLEPDYPWRAIPFDPTWWE